MATCHLPVIFYPIVNMKSSFLGSILIAFAIINNVSADVKTLDDITYQDYYRECDAAELTGCNAIEYCAIEKGNHLYSYRMLHTEASRASSYS